MGVGGSIPFIAEFLEAFPQASVLVTGVEDPDTRAHGANEGLHLAEFEKVVLAEAFLLRNLGALAAWRHPAADARRSARVRPKSHVARAIRGRPAMRARDCDPCAYASPHRKGGDGRLTAALDPHDQGPQDACGVFGVWAPGEDVAKLDLLRPLRAPAPRPGVGGHRGQQRPADPGLQGHGPGLAGLRRVDPRVAQGPPRGRPLAATPPPGPAPGRTRSRRSAPPPTGPSRSATTAT